MNIHPIEQGDSRSAQARRTPTTKTTSTLLFIAFLFMSFNSFAQPSGRTDMRFAIYEVDCANQKIYVDIEIRADNSPNLFNLAEQNYRISFNRAALANPLIHEELEISGIVFQGPDASFYSPHTMTGSNDTIISYNIELSGGPGWALSDVDYTKVGRLSFDVVDFNAEMRLHFHTKDPLHFPPSIIIEKENNALHATAEGSYGNFYHSLSSACGNSAPVATNDGATTLFGTAVTVDVLSNDVDPEDRLDPNSLIISIQPPTAQGTAAVNTVTGEITFTPAAGYFGTVSPIQYDICDKGTEFPAAHGELNLDPVPVPDPQDPPMSSGTPLCSSAFLSIEVESGVGPQSINLKLFIEGAHGGNGTMTTNLSNLNLIPLQQPYNAAPWLYSGTESANNIPPNAVDWVLITVRTGVNSSTTVDTLAAFLTNNGQVVSSEGGSLNLAPDLVTNSLYISVYHRNHVGIMSSQEVVAVNNVYNYDFTDSASKYFGGSNGTNEVEPGLWAMISGDYNANGQVQNTDYNSMTLEIGLSGYRPSDFDLNSQSQNSDLQGQLTPNIGRGASFSF